ncbi:hypothetical protein HanIR_Chr01g0050001 [Helianthus annuus]|nr:hypothetical protein HanIR_Chr01g0050001 [Helianthus annuus]
MVYKASNSAFTGCINYIFFINFEKVTSTFILQLLSRLIFNFSSVSNTLPHYFTNILNNLIFK